MTTGLQAITKALKSGVSRWEAVQPAFLHLPDGEVVVVHLLNHGHQSVAQVVEPEDITKQVLAFALSNIQILGYYRFDGSTWELISDMLDAIDASTKDAPKLFEEQLLEHLLVPVTVRSDLSAPVPDDVEEFFLHRVGDEQCIAMAVAGDDFALVPEHPLGRFTAPKGTVAMYWPAIEKERENARRASELGSLLGNLLGTAFAVVHDHSSHEDTDEAPPTRSRRWWRRSSAEPAPGMGASEGKDFQPRESEDRGEPPYVSAGLAGTRSGQAASDIG